MNLLKITSHQESPRSSVVELASTGIRKVMGLIPDHGLRIFLSLISAGVKANSNIISMF
jgi:hypothetical protein